DLTMGGPSMDLESGENLRRSVYAKVSRSRLHPLLRLYDFPDATQHSPGREVTTTPVQQLFVLNSQFLQNQAEALAERSAGESDRVRFLYRRVFSRDPKPPEVDRAGSFLSKAKQQMGREAWPEYAQALLGTNEFIYLQ